MRQEGSSCSVRTKTNDAKCGNLGEEWYGMMLGKWKGRQATVSLPPFLAQSE